MLSDVELERAMVAALLLAPDRVSEALALVRPSDFSDAKLRHLYAACESLFVHGVRIDLTTVAAQMRLFYSDFTINDLMTYMSAPCDPDNLVDYAQRIGTLATRRRYVDAASQLAALAHQERDVGVLSGKAMALLTEMQSERRTMGTAQVSQIWREHYEQRLRSASDPVADGLKSFCPHINRICTCYERGRVYTFCGRPGMGKTSWLMTEFAHQAAQGKRVIFFELEMMQSEVLDSLAAVRSGVPYSAIRYHRFADADQFARYTRTINEIQTWTHAYIDCTPRITPGYVLNVALMLRQQLGGLDGVFIDYLGLMDSDDRKELNRDRIAAITRVMKAHAKTINAPIILAAQLSRAVEMRASGRPQLSDLAESGTIEQDSDAVLAFWRDEDAVPSGLAADETLIQVAFLKGRFEQISDFTVAFRGSTRSFSDRLIESEPICIENL